ncbi:DNA repair protein RecO [Polycladidibacter hongkongensis]|uniref:DNA repair protein RecO n=1 Tax=Polycladidibacter hongkongensis TaxID=1647556 RepID=UPI0008343906|nr:DNA repair protein RecO [Pseudovibrio hongkongensis]
MQWQGEGIIIGSRKQGENNLVLEVMTLERGRCMGLVRGGRSRRQQPSLQPGNHVSLAWRGRLDEHLGAFTIEPLQQRAAALMQAAHSLHALQTLCALLRLLPERDPHPRLFHALDVILDHLDDPHIGALLLVRFELELLGELGFGLDLTNCAATGATEDLIWVSPRSGRAVCRTAGAPYAAKLLELPAFLRSNDESNSFLATQAMLPQPIEEIVKGFELTGYFLHKYIYEPRTLNWPPARDSYLNALRRSQHSASENVTD